MVTAKKSIIEMDWPGEKKVDVVRDSHISGSSRISGNGRISGLRNSRISWSIRIPRPRNSRNSGNNRNFGLRKSSIFGTMASSAFMCIVNMETIYTDKGISLPEPMRMSDWLREIQFWKVSVLYISARLFSNISLAYIALYLDVTLQLRPTNVAIVPLVMFLSGLCASALQDTFVRICGQRGALVIACLMGLAGSVWVGIRNFNSNSFRDTEIYVVAALYGSAASGMLITGISATANLVGKNVESAALVYGLISMTDKISQAITFGVIQELVPDDNEAE